MFGMLYFHKVLWNFESTKKGRITFSAQLDLPLFPASLMKYLSLLVTRFPLRMSIE